MIDISDVLVFKYPGKEYVVGETYESLIWLDKTMPKPTQDEVVAATAEYKVFLKNTEYRRLRKYPKVEDQLDMLFNDIKNNNLTHGDFVKSIEKVKKKYPKPD